MPIGVYPQAGLSWRRRNSFETAAARLCPAKVFRFEGEKVYIKRVGNAVVLLPYRDSWRTLFESL
jgi:virulence-associated protein VagC